MLDVAPSKPCTMCGEFKPATKEHFSAKKKGKNGLASACLLCLSAAARARRAKESPEAAEARRSRARECARSWRASADAYHAKAAVRLERARKWREANPDNVRAWSARSRALQRSRTEYRLQDAMRSGIRRSLKSKKNGSWRSCVDYSIDDLIRHLERQFTRGMSWDNYGEWHIDHIIPMSAFSFTSSKDANFSACWALTNLRPLWWLENIRKYSYRLTIL